MIDMEVYYGTITGYKDLRHDPHDHWRQKYQGMKGIIYIIHAEHEYIRFFEMIHDGSGKATLGSTLRTGTGDIERNGSRITISTRNSQYDFELEENLTEDPAGDISPDLQEKYEAKRFTKEIVLSKMAKRRTETLEDIFFGTLTVIKDNDKDREKEQRHQGLTGIIFVYAHGESTFDILMYEVIQDDDGITFGDNLTILGGLLFISEDEKQMMIADKHSRFLIDLQQKLTDDSTEGLPDRMRLMHAASRLILRLLPPGSILIPDHDTYKEVYDRGFQDGRRDMLEEVAIQSNTDEAEQPLPF